MTKAEQFFYDHAGYSWNSKDGETQEQGRVRCAKEMAAAEQWAKDNDYSFEWSQDDITNREWTNDGPEYYLWACIMYDADDNPVQSLGGIDFGHTGDDDAEYAEAREPWGDPYKRVVEAELACEQYATELSVMIDGLPSTI